MTPPAESMPGSRNTTPRKRTCERFGGWVGRYGRPLAHYTDKNSIFRKAGPQPLPEQLRGDPLRTQFGRALNELGIEWIAAHSPQAKGRIERLFETLQDRLVKEMRLAGIDSIAAANHFLEMHFLPEWEQRFTVAPRNARNAHRRLGREQRLEEILSVRVARRVAQDHTVSWDGNRWGVLREEVCAGLRGAQVEIERRLDGSHWLRFRGRYVHLRRLSRIRATYPQVLPAYGLQDLRNEQREPKTRSNPNTMCPQITLGENHGSGHFYLAENRTFLLCVDTGIERACQDSFPRSVSLDVSSFFSLAIVGAAARVACLGRSDGEGPIVCSAFGLQRTLSSAGVPAADCSGRACWSGPCPQINTREHYGFLDISTLPGIHGLQTSHADGWIFDLDRGQAVAKWCLCRIYLSNHFRLSRNPL